TMIAPPAPSATIAVGDSAKAEGAIWTSTVGSCGHAARAGRATAMALRATNAMAQRHGKPGDMAYLRGRDACRVPAGGISAPEGLESPSQVGAHPYECRRR